MNRSVLQALGAAALFGAGTPFAQRLGVELPPLLLGGLLYLGSGIGLSGARLLRDRGWAAPGIARADWPWLLGAIFFGGLLGPVLLMFGLRHASAASASLLLNLESVLTALIAWLVFKENAGRRPLLGMAAIVAGGVVLSWPRAGSSAAGDLIGPAAIAAACLCWAIDNNLTRRVSAADALFIAAIKGLIAGTVNTALAFAFGVGVGHALPAALNAMTVIAAMSLGLLSYGASLVLLVLALRGLGAARTGAYFSTAPFIGAAVSLLLFGEPASAAFWAAAALMAVGVWLHLTERHEHEHSHGDLRHTHPHYPDAEHRHAHD